MKVPDFGTDTSNPDVRGTDMIPGDLGPEEILGLRGSNRDVGRWRGEIPSRAALLMAAGIMQKNGTFKMAGDVLQSPQSIDAWARLNQDKIENMRALERNERGLPANMNIPKVLRPSNG